MLWIENPDGAFGKITRQVAALSFRHLKQMKMITVVAAAFTLFIILITQMSYCVLMKLHYYSVT